MKRLQRSQVELVEAIADTGPNSEESMAYAAEVEEDRRVLAEVTS